MKKYILAILLIVVCIPLLAQYKVVEKSDRKYPAWIGKTDSNFIIVSAEGISLEEAQKKAMANIKQEIINSVAVNINSTEKYAQNQLTKDNITTIFEDYSSNVNSVGARLPFISDITTTKANDVYWQKCYNKKKKLYNYAYHIKYPFSGAERSALISEFLKIDNEKSDMLKLLQSNFNNFTEIEYIDYAIGALQPLIEYFFDNTRKSEAIALQNNYRKQYANITIVPVEEKLGEYKYALYLNERVVTTSKLPKVVSDYVTNIEVKPIINEKLYVITYNYEYSNEADDNIITLTYAFGGRGLKQTFAFDIRDKEAKK